MYETCSSPLKAIDLGTKSNGKKNIKILPRDVVGVKYVNGSWRYFKKGDFFEPSAPHTYTEFIELPCGHCTACRLKHSRQWADRCVLESMYHESSYFVTLTYKDEFLPLNTETGMDVSTGECAIVETLVKKHFQDFMKRLRKNYVQYCIDHDVEPNNLRFFGCGEYGEKHGRPHYHIIVFGLKLFDLKPDGLSHKDYQQYQSDFLDKCWSVDSRKYPNLSDKERIIGRVRVGSVTWDSCCYTARYCLKKLGGEFSHFYDDAGITPEFVLMSRKPGIAYQYYADHKDQIYDTDKIHIKTERKGITTKPSRYYDSLFDIDDHEKMDSIKKQRKTKAICMQSQTVKQSSLPIDEIRRIQENALKERISKLVRRYEIGKA